MITKKILGKSYELFSINALRKWQKNLPCAEQQTLQRIIYHSLPAYDFEVLLFNQF